MRTHRPRTHACPLPGCDARCASPTDVVLHLLARPHAGLSRARFDAYVLNSPLRPLVVVMAGTDEFDPYKD